MESALPSASKSGLGEIDNSAICVGVGAKAKKIKSQSKYTDKDRYIIAKYFKDRAPNQASKCLQSKYPTFRELTLRRFLKKFIEKVWIEKTLNQPPAKRITNLTRGRALMVGSVVD